MKKREREKEVKRERERKREKERKKEKDNEHVEVLIGTLCRMVLFQIRAGAPEVQMTYGIFVHFLLISS